MTEHSSMHAQTNRRRLMAASLALTAFAVAACQRGNAADAPSSGPVATAVGPENIVVLQSDELATGPAISGNLRAAEEATVRAEISGTVLQTYADEGSRVARGALLARIDDSAIRDQFLSARSGVTAAQTAADLAQRELERAEKLSAAGAIADRDVEAARRGHVAAQSQLADAKARLTLAQKQIDDARVESPFTGIISQRQVSAGDLVQPGGAMYTVIDPTSMRLEASVPANQLGAVSVGAPVTFRVSGYPDRSFTGKISRVNPVADPSTGQVRVVVAIPNASNNLVGGLFAEGRITSGKHTGLVAPVSAVDVRGVRPFVIRLQNGAVEKVEVEVGARDDETDRIEILKGLAEGDTLLVGAAMGLTPGTPVRVSAPSDTAASKN
jgi:RND family efflux transporter MFP subunit